MNSTCSCGKSPARLAEIPPRVLVIDDEPLVRWSLTAGLRAAGFDAVAAADAADALAVARQSPPPRVVLFDIRLWDTDPERLLRDLRTASPDCRFLILAVSGQDVPCAQFEGVEVIRKPFDLDEVVRVVESSVCPAAHHLRPAVL
jgi:DNA-binding NtrC family response regulator